MWRERLVDELVQRFQSLRSMSDVRLGRDARMSEYCRVGTQSPRVRLMRLNIGGGGGGLGVDLGFVPRSLSWGLFWNLRVWIE